MKPLPYALRTEVPAESAAAARQAALQAVVVAANATVSDGERIEIDDGGLFHWMPCSHCEEGIQWVQVCGHSYGCDCALKKRTCVECDGSGEEWHEDHDCFACRMVAEALEAEAEAEHDGE